ncbi:MAG: tetratricopeptide repeat protein [bacterium]
MSVRSIDMPASGPSADVPRKPKKTPPSPLPTSKYSKWRALTLAAIYPLMAIHILHWKLAGKTLAPLELHEVMFTAELGIITAGFILMALVAVATLVFGRFFCSWACHIMVLQDGASWLLRKLHITPKPVRSRFLLWVPPLVLLYMFGWPQITRMWAGRPFPMIRTQTDLEGISSFVTTNFWRNLPNPWIAALTFLVCGFLVVYLLGSRGFCNYGCPYGVLFLTVDRFAPGRIRVDRDKCAQCGTCTAVCTSGVRVHEEVDVHGMVVNPRCLKDLDCVSCCPEKALHYRWGKPSLGRLWSGRATLIAAAVLALTIVVALIFPGAQNWWAGRFDLVPFGLAVLLLGLVAYGRTGMPARHYHFTLGEESLMAVVFVATLLIYRQLYDQIPFLLTIGLGGAAAYATVVFVRLFRQLDVRVVQYALRTNGALKGKGVLFATVMAAFFALTIHSAFVQYHTHFGYAALADARAAASAGNVAAPVLRDRALQHLLWSDRWGLYRSERLQQSLAAIYLDRSDFPRAETYLRQVIARDAGNPDAHLQLGRALVSLSRPDEAEAQFAEVLRVKTSLGFRQKELLSLQAQAHYELGALQLTAGRIDDAAQSLRAALSLDPKMAEAHYNLAIACLNQGRRDEAIAEAEAAAALAPSDLQTQELLAHLKQAPAALPD